MVDHNHNRIKAQGKEKISDQVNGELPERKRNGGQDRTKWGNGRMCVDFVLLANHAASDEVLDKGGETQPPKVTPKDRPGVENAHVTQEERRMDGVEESGAGRGRNIHAIAKIKMSIVKQPIREAGMSEQGGTFVQSCQDLEDKGIRGRGVLDVVG